MREAAADLKAGSETNMDGEERDWEWYIVSHRMKPIVLSIYSILSSRI